MARRWPLFTQNGEKVQEEGIAPQSPLREAAQPGWHKYTHGNRNHIQISPWAFSYQTCTVVRHSRWLQRWANPQIRGINGHELVGGLGEPACAHLPNIHNQLVTTRVYLLPKQILFSKVSSCQSTFCSFFQSCLYRCGNWSFLVM